MNAVEETTLVFTAIFTLFAALAAWKSADVGRRATEASACSQFAQDVSHWVAEWVSEMSKNVSDRAQWAVDVDTARREVTGYFFWLARFYEGGLVTRRFVVTAGKIAGINLFYDLCEPLERALNPQDYAVRSFRILARVVGRFGNEGEPWGRIVPSPRSS